MRSGSIDIRISRSNARLCETFISTEAPELSGSGETVISIRYLPVSADVSPALSDVEIPQPESKVAVATKTTHAVGRERETAGHGRGMFISAKQFMSSSVPVG
ncbi:MAG: hypothetical protein RLN69_16315 [Woeseiaceae bacterium]